MLLEGNGASVLRASYAALNTKLSGLSYPFGTVDGTHMTLPDLQGRSPLMMASGGHADVNALGDSDGLAKASRTPNVTIAAHTHTGPSHTHSTPAHSHGVSITTSGPTGTAAGTTPGDSSALFANASHTHAVSGNTATEGGGTTGAGGTGATGSGGGATGSGSFLVVGVVGVKYRPTI
jgi:hypothetical protein